MRQGLLSHLVLALKGAAMGVADTVPGVSGGTVAFVTGIYEELVASLARIGPARLVDLKTGGVRRFWYEINGNFLLSVFGGLLIALFAVAELMNWLLTHYRIVLWGFFFGLILASVPLVLARLKRWQPSLAFWLALGVAVGLGITLLGPGSTPDALWMIFLAGFIAISAMVLPGISGSFLLLLMAKYETMVGAVVERELLTIFVFALGALVGVLSVARLLAALFRRHHDATVAVLTGFMLGSLNALWPWQYGLGQRGGLAAHHWPWRFEEAAGQAPQIGAVMLAFMAGIGLIAMFWSAETARRRRDQVI